MKRTLRRLDKTHQKLIATIAPIGAEEFSRRPAPEQWSVAEIVQHLYLVEARVIKDLQRALAREPQRVNRLRRLIPTSIVASRLLRVKAPSAVNPLASLDKDTAIENFQQARNTLSELCATHGARRFRQIVFNHPFLGKLDGVATVSFVGYHERRHHKQILEVLRKIENSPPK
ncbi:MAG: hypothetical protein QOD75_350 [Blastocatellia bacterium]|jgi:uncharacterized damage-inducible protein DinB|nr:hypothetical protein [Blastocatellia bacterium]